MISFEDAMATANASTVEELKVIAAALTVATEEKLQEVMQTGELSEDLEKFLTRLTNLMSEHYEL